MKKIVPILILAFATSGLFAQITVTNATFPAAGDTLKTATDNSPSGVAITPPGGNYQWDFSGLEANTTQQLVYRPASEGSVVVAGAELFAALGGSNTEGYYNVTATSFEWLAFQGPAPGGLNIPTLMKFNPPLVERRAPMAFFDINQVTSNLTLPFSSDVIPDTILQNLPIVPDSIRFRITSQRLDVVDAWGNLTIPGGSYDVLREKRTEYRSTAVDVKVPILGWIDLSTIGNIPGLNMGTDTILTYNFFSNVAKEPIAVVTMDNQQANATQVTFKNTGLVNAAGDVASPQPAVTVSPNPVAGEANFELKNMTPGDYSLQLFTAQGRLVLVKRFKLSGAHSERVELGNLLPGLYSYGIFDGQKKQLAGGKLIKTE